jgi:spore maturation protein CgeB
VPFSLSFNRIAASAVLIDSSPFFKAGIHDRVFAGMANYTAVLTEANPYKSKYKGLFETYQIEDLKEMVYKSEELLINNARRQCMVDKAHEDFEAEHTWARTAQKLDASWKK